MATTSRLMDRGLADRLRHGMPARPVVDNATARAAALGSLVLATVLVARLGGPEDVGILALLRALPGLVGVVAACGLPGAMAYFLSGPDARHRALWPTTLLLMGVGAAAGTVFWLAVSRWIGGWFLSGVPLPVVAVAGVTVATQLPVAVGKSCLQGMEDMRGANWVIVAEEASYLPIFGLSHLMGLRSGWAIVVSLLAADVAVAAGAWLRIVLVLRRRRVPLQGRADRELAKRMAGFGWRNQVGGVLGLVNLRLDFLVLGAIAGPAAVGIYAVASKLAELLRLPALALTWVAYPKIARLGPQAVVARVRRLGPQLLATGLGGAVLLAAVAVPTLPWVYGREFSSARWPALIIVAGLVVEPWAGLATGYLLGTGRPGLNSWLQGVGVIATLVLDVVLIPRFGVVGAAVASAVAYLLTDAALVVALHRLTAERART